MDSKENPSKISQKEEKKISDENVLNQFEDLTPINLVDFVEKYYHTFLKNQNKENLNILSSYKSKNSLKFQLIDFSLKNRLTKILQPKISTIQTLKIYGDHLLLADQSGSVYMYSISKEAELQILTPPENINYYATSIDNSPNLEFVVIGYSNGNIILWDTKNLSIIYTIKDLYSSKILFIKFTKIEKNCFEIISSDITGKVLKILITIGFFSKSVKDFMIYKDDAPTYDLTQFKPLRNKNIVIGAFFNVNKIKVYIIRPVLSYFFGIGRPDFYDENCTDIPDISFGWGFEPFKSEEDYVQMKFDQTTRTNKIFLAVSWGQIIRIYSLDIKGEDIVLNGEGPKSYFINDSPVIRLGFISPSIIYFFDKNEKVKIINTLYTQYGEYHQEKKGEFVYNKRALIEEGKIISPNFIKINVSNNDKKELFCYRYFIQNMNKCIYICTEEGFYFGKVLKYDECIYNLIKEEDWLGAMSLTNDIYHGNITSFSDIPNLRIERIETLKPFLKCLLTQYIEYNLEEKEKKYIKKIDLIQSINVIIEFCLSLNEIEFLFEIVEKSFRKKGKSDLFYQNLEPFIFNDLLYKYDINEKFLISLYTEYKENQSLSKLQHLLTHINYKSLQSMTIKKILFKENLFTLMILIFSNNKGSENFFFPIAKIYKVFEEKIKNSKNTKYLSYIDAYGNEGIKGINMMEDSIEYIGHKLLWYIGMSIKGNKFSFGMDSNLLKFDINSKDYQSFIALIFYWILQEDVFTNLIRFDSYSFLNIISSFLTNQFLLNIIKSFDFTQFNMNIIRKKINELEIDFLKDNDDEVRKSKEISDKKEKEKEKDELDYNNINTIMNYIIQIAQKEKGFFIEIDLGILLLKFASKYSEKTPILPTIKKKVTESFIKCLTFYEDYKKLKETFPNEAEDIFNCHKVKKIVQIEKIDKEKNSFYEEMNLCLNDILDSSYEWEKDDLNKILEAGKKCPFSSVKLKLNKEEIVILNNEKEKINQLTNQINQNNNININNGLNKERVEIINLVNDLKIEKDKNIKLSEELIQERIKSEKLLYDLKIERDKNIILSKELNKEKNKIKELTNNLNLEKEKNINLNAQLNLYLNNVNELNSKISSLEATIKKYYNEELNKSKSSSNLENCKPGEKIMAINFISTDQKVNYCLPCKNTDIFVRLEEKLYDEYPEYKEENTYFTVSGNSNKRFKSMQDNKIKNSDIIILNIYE